MLSMPQVFEQSMFLLFDRLLRRKGILPKIRGRTRRSFWKKLLRRPLAGKRRKTRRKKNFVSKLFGNRRMDEGNEFDEIQAAEAGSREDRMEAEAEQ